MGELTIREAILKAISTCNTIYIHWASVVRAQNQDP